MLPEFRYKDCTSLWLCCFVASWHPGLEVDKAKPRDNAASDFQEWTRGMVGAASPDKDPFQIAEGR